MTIQELLAELEQMGTAQNRKVYKRHGVREPMFGVSYGHLDKLKKRVKVDHGLAQALWATGNHDARVLATKIANPKETTAEELEAWADGLHCYVLTDGFSGFVNRTPYLREKMDAWIVSDEEWRGRAGWQLLAHLALKKKKLPDAFFMPYLVTIEEEIHGRKNRVRDAMNSALIAIGMRNDELEALATAAAERIGKVEVDHGQTSCKTPEAIPYIRKARARQRQRKRKRKR